MGILATHETAILVPASATDLDILEAADQARTRWRGEMSGVSGASVVRSVGRAGLPPVALTHRNRSTLTWLAVVAVGTAFQGSLPSASLTYAAREWANTTAEQTRALAVIRADIVLTVILMRVADRIGRRRLLLITASVGPVFTALCGAAPNIVTFTALQVVARAFVTASAVLITVIVVEEMPAGARAWSSGALVVAAAIGAAMAVGAVGIADQGVRVWRVLYVLPLLSTLAIPFVARYLPESERFLLHRVHDAGAGIGSPTGTHLLFREVVRGARTYRRRLAMLCAFLALLAFQNTPSRQLQNEYLRLDRGFSSKVVAAFSILSNAPGIVGLVLGSVLAHRVGHKRLLAIGCFSFAVCDAAMFVSHGVFVWVWSIVGALLGGASLPVLGIITAELFPTTFRSTANGITLAASRLGGALGLLVVGFATRFWSRGVSIASTSLVIGVAMIVLRRLPETGGRELEALNPEDAAA